MNKKKKLLILCPLRVAKGLIWYIRKECKVFFGRLPAYTDSPWTEIDEQIDEHTDKQTDAETDRQTDRQTDRYESGWKCCIVYMSYKNINYKLQCFKSETRVKLLCIYIIYIHILKKIDEYCKIFIHMYIHFVSKQHFDEQTCRPTDSRCIFSVLLRWDIMLLKCELMLLKCQINTNANKNGFLLSAKCKEMVLKYSYLVPII